MKYLVKKQPSGRKKIQVAAFSLVEVTIALGICAFAFLTMMGVLAVGMNANRDTVGQTKAAAVARSVVADLLEMDDWDVTSNPGPESRRYRIIQVLSSSASAGPQTIYVTEDGEEVPQNDSDYRIDITFGAQLTNQPPSVHIAVSWPGAAPSSTNWPENTFGTYEVRTTLRPL